MKIHEYQAAALFKEAGIPVPPGEVASSPEEAVRIFRQIGRKAVIKAQVHSGGRGKAGGVVPVATAGEAEAESRRILSMSIGGFPVEKVLLVPACDIIEEFYVGITIDRGAGEAVLILSPKGGIDIETLALSEPEQIVRIPLTLDPGRDRERLAVLYTLFPGPEASEQAMEIILSLIRMFREKDCTLAEINPLALDSSGNLVALDAKVNLDDNALFLHPDLNLLKEKETDEERQATKVGISYVGLDGDIGCIVNGAGLAMATMDAIHHFGAQPANFLDVGGSSDPRKMVTALRIVSAGAGVRVILVNIFGGITRCDDIARGIIMGLEEVDISVPLVIRLTGTNEEAGGKMLADRGFTVLSDMEEAVKTAVQISGGLK